jgi:hypothetical protein
MRGRVNSQYLKEVRASCTRHLFLYSLPDREELSIVTFSMIASGHHA